MINFIENIDKYSNPLSKIALLFSSDVMWPNFTKLKEIYIVFSIISLIN